MITGAESSAGTAGPRRVPAWFPARLSLSTTAPHRASPAPRASAAVLLDSNLDLSGNAAVRRTH